VIEPLALFTSRLQFYALTNLIVKKNIQPVKYDSSQVDENRTVLKSLSLQ